MRSNSLMILGRRPPLFLRIRDQHLDINSVFTSIFRRWNALYLCTVFYEIRQPAFHGCNRWICPLLHIEWGKLRLSSKIFCSFSASGTLLVRSVIWKIRPCDIASFLIGLGVALGYVFTKKAWELSNIISLAIMGSSVKLFKIRSYKSALIVFLKFIKFLLPSCACDVIMATISHYVYPESYNILVLQYFNLPMELAIPLFKS